MVDKSAQGLEVHRSLSVGMKIEEVGGCLSNRCLRLCRGCSLCLGLVVVRSERMAVRGVCGVRIVSGVACFVSDHTFSRKGRNSLSLPITT